MCSSAVEVCRRKWRGVGGCGLIFLLLWLIIWMMWLGLEMGVSVRRMEGALMMGLGARQENEIDVGDGCGGWAEE